jgi:hypothetical protein
MYTSKKYEVILRGFLEKEVGIYQRGYNSRINLVEIFLVWICGKHHYQQCLELSLAMRPLIVKSMKMIL